MKITVILTSYNHKKYLRESIESVLNQTYQDFKLIIVDDCSRDGSWDIIQEYKKKNKNITAIGHDYNWGSGAAEYIVRNHIKEGWIALQHSDDIWALDKLEKQVEYAKKNPECAAIFTNAQVIDDEGNEYSDKDGFYYHLFSAKNRSRYEWLNYFFYQGNCLCHPSILIKKEAYQDDGFFRKGLRQIPDFVKWIQVCKKYEIHVLQEALVKFRFHSSGKNTSGMRVDTQIRSAIELFLMLDEYKSFTKRDEFVKIFPEAKAYCEGDVFVPEYALGKLCTKEGVQPYTRLYGIKLLYEALNDPIKSKVMEEQYQYTKKEFMDNNGKYDIFSIVPPHFEQKRTIYFDYGDGWLPETAASEKFTFGDELTYNIKLSIDEKMSEKIKAIRFDPVESVMVKSRIERIQIDEKVVTCYPDNAAFHENGYDVFVDLDPRYIIEFEEKDRQSKKKNIYIKGTICRLTDDDIHNSAQKNKAEKLEMEDRIGILERNEKDLQDQTYYLQRDNTAMQSLIHNLEESGKELQEQIYQLQTERGTMQEQIYSLQTEKNSLQTEKTGLEREIEYLKEERGILLRQKEEYESTRLYKVAYKVKQLRERVKWKE